MEILRFLHSNLAYLVIILVALGSINSLIGMFTKKEFEAKDFRIALFGLIVTHTHILIAIFFYILANDFGNPDVSIGDIMKISLLRMKNVEHPLLMVIAIVLLTIGYSKHKSMRTSAKKFKTLAIFYTLALILILSRIPWGIWFN